MMEDDYDEDKPWEGDMGEIEVSVIILLVWQKLKDR